MAIVLVGQGGTGSSSGGSYPSPGPAISYHSVNGNTLIVSGGIDVHSGSVTGITSITDSAGNAWQYATSNNQNPPSAVADTSYYFCSYIGWCIDAMAVTSVTVTGDVGNSADWLIAVSEWNGISAADEGLAVTGTNANPSGTLDLSYPGDLVVGAFDSSVNAPTALPRGWTGFRDIGSPAVYGGYAIAASAGFYTAAWTMLSDTYTLALMSFYSTGATAPPPPGMRAF